MSAVRARRVFIECSMFERQRLVISEPLLSIFEYVASCGTFKFPDLVIIDPEIYYRKESVLLVQ